MCFREAAGGFTLQQIFLNFLGLTICEQIGQKLEFLLLISIKTSIARHKLPSNLRLGEMLPRFLDIQAGKHAVDPCASSTQLLSTSNEADPPRISCAGARSGR